MSLYLSIFAIFLLMFLGLPLYLIIFLGSLLAFNQDFITQSLQTLFSKFYALLTFDFNTYKSIELLTPEPEELSIFLEMIRLKDTPLLLAIPLFTFTGFILSRSKAPQRIILLSQTFLGWLPGGIPIIAIISCALLTAFTGASGVTIIALGGLLYPILLKENYDENFTLGLLTTSGSRGLLFPPSLPLILYAVITEISIEKLFRASLIPGLIGILVMIFYAIFKGRTIPQKSNQWLGFKTYSSILIKNGFELPLPFLVLGGIYGGMITVTEAACLSALYVVLVECFILKEIDIKTELPDITCEAMILVGSILIILAASFGFTYFLVDAQIPDQILSFIQGTVKTKWLFLLLLNLLLLIVGCIMDIFSALLIVVPLIKPLAEEYDINLFHLGVIFLTNLEIGYSTPPVGLNLFISSARFKKPVLTLYRATLPYLALLFLVLILVTYVPILTTFLIS